jgi:hypothetical protein
VRASIGDFNRHALSRTAAIDPALLAQVQEVVDSLGDLRSP